MFQRSWKKPLKSDVILTRKMRFCNECNKEKCCDRCNNQNNENKNFEAEKNLLKRQPPNELGHVLTYFKNKMNFL